MKLTIIHKQNSYEKYTGRCGAGQKRKIPVIVTPYSKEVTCPKCKEIINYEEQK